MEPVGLPWRAWIRLAWLILFAAPACVGASLEVRCLLHEPARGLHWLQAGSNIVEVPTFPGMPRTPGSRVLLQWPGPVPTDSRQWTNAQVFLLPGTAFPKATVRLQDRLGAERRSAVWVTDTFAALQSHLEEDHLAVDVLVEGQPGVCQLHGVGQILAPPRHSTIRVTGLLLPSEGPGRPFIFLVPDTSLVTVEAPDLSRFFPGPLRALPTIRDGLRAGQWTAITGSVATITGPREFVVDSGGMKVEVRGHHPLEAGPGGAVQVAGTWRPADRPGLTGRIEPSLVRSLAKTGSEPFTLEPVLRSLAAIEALPNAEAARSLPVSIDAVVTGDYTRFNEPVLFLQDETASIYCYPGNFLGTNFLGLEVGERVRVEGETSPGNFASDILATTIRPLGSRRPLRSSQVPLDFLKGGHFDSRWVEIAGVVTRGWTTNGMARMELSDGTESIEIRLGSPETPLRFLESIVRIHGVVATRYNEERQAVGAYLWCPSELFVEIEEAPPSNPFDSPVRPIGWHRGFRKRTPGPSRTHIRGIVTAELSKGHCIVQSGMEAVEVHASSETTPPPGTEVDVAGLVAWVGDRLELRRGQFRQLRLAGMPGAVDFSAKVPTNEVEEIRRTILEGVRRTVEGVVLSSSIEPGATRLILKDEVPVEIRIPIFGNRIYQMDLKPGALLRVTGATRTRVDENRRITGAELVAGQPGDVILLRDAPLWNPGNIAIAIASTSVVLLVAYLWMASLRLKVRQQAQEIDARYRTQADLERRNAELVEQAGEIILELASDGRILSTNPAAARFFRRPPAELLQSRLGELVSADHRPAVLQALESALRGSAETLQVQTARGRGAPLWLELRIQRYGTGDQGSLLGAVGRDISDRRQAELALQQSEQNLRRIIEFLPDGVILLDRAGAIRFQNRRASVLLGFPQDGLVGSHVGVLRNRALEVWVRDLLEASDAEDGSVRHDALQTLDLARLEGTELLADVSVGVVRRSDDRSCLVCFRDAAPRIAAEETLRNQATLARVESGLSRTIGLAEDPHEMLYQCVRLLVSLAGVAVARFWFRASPGAPLVLAAAAADRDFFGNAADLPPPPGSWESLLGKPDGFHQVDFLSSEPGLVQASLAGLISCRVHALPGGELGDGLLEVFFRKPTNATIAPLLGGTVSAIAGGLVRLQAVHRLNQTNSKLKAVLASAPVAILELALDKRVLDLNPAAETLFRRSADQVRGMRFPDLFGPDSPLAQRLREVIDGATLTGIETALQQPDGTSTPCSLYAASIPPAAEIVCVLVDLTERDRMEAEAEKIQRKLRDAQRLESLGVMAGGIAHDFNNILGAILGNAGLARSRPQADPEIRESLDEIGRAAQRAGELCRLMLAYAGQAGLGRQSADLSEIVRDTLRLVRHGVSKLAEIELDLESPLPPTPLDTAQVRQIVLNLVTNASEALGDRPGRIRIRTAVADPADTSLPHAELPAERHVLLEVSDTGCGMDESVVSRIFDPFFTTKFAGRGLGLAAVWGVVRGHSGQIAVHSVPGRGSTFRVWLPCPVAPSSAPEHAAPKAAEPGAFPKLVLLVDDEAPLRTITRQILKRFGAEVLEAADGAAGLDLILRNRERKPVVLLDVTMPKMSGHDVLTRLREQAPEIRVVLMSGYVEADNPEKRPEGAAAFLSKPFTAETLREVLSRLDRP